MGNFFSFRWMVTPLIIQLLFAIGTLVIVAVGCVLVGRGLRQHDDNRLFGIAVIVLGPLALRVWCELVIVVFRINSTLTDIRERAPSGT